MRKRFHLTLCVLAAGLLAACANTPPQPSVASSTQGTTLVQYAQVTNVRDVAVHGGRSNGVGSMVGAVLGGIAGSAIGSGHGRSAAIVGGSVAGSMAGQHLAQSGVTNRSTALTVRFSNGDERTYTVDSDDNFRVGDEVRVITANGVTRVTR